MHRWLIGVSSVLVLGAAATGATAQSYNAKAAEAAYLRKQIAEACGTYGDPDECEELREDLAELEGDSPSRGGASSGPSPADMAMMQAAQQTMIMALAGKSYDPAMMPGASSYGVPAYTPPPLPRAAAPRQMPVPNVTAGFAPPTYSYRSPAVPTAPAWSPSMSSGIPYTAPSTASAGTGSAVRGDYAAQPSASPTPRVGTQCISQGAGKLVNRCEYPVSVRFCMTNPTAGTWHATFTCPNMGEVGPIPARGERALAQSGHVYWLGCEGRSLFQNARWTGSSLSMSGCIGAP